MQTIHIITDGNDRELVKRLFRKKVNDIASHADDIYNNINGDVNFYEDQDCNTIFGDGAIVYDVLGGGDPELGWIVYDFVHTRCHVVEERDLAGLCNELPKEVLPF